MDFMRQHKWKLRVLILAVLAILSTQLFSNILFQKRDYEHPIPIDLNIPDFSQEQSHPQQWPYTPFRTNGAEILDTLNEPVVLAGVNWPGHGLPMIPEGLHHQSIKDIVAKVKSLGMNIVRLTYATEMLDDIYANDEVDVGLKDSLVKALGIQNGTKVYDEIVDLNPSLGGDKVTRLDVFDAVANELERQHIYVHLDNHISKAGWCCSLEDGNGWFGDTYFNSQNWVRGLKYMSSHASKWPNLISISLRNELRDTPSNPSIHATYNWSTWYDHMIPALHSVHTANPHALIFISGMEWDRTLEPVIHGHDLGSGRVVDLTTLPTQLRQKIVWEIHNYNNSISSCEALTAQLDAAGYSLLKTTLSHASNPEGKEDVKVNLAPIVLTEFGFPQTSDASGSHSVYAQCLKSHLTGLKAGWMYWVIVGSYYEREGEQEFDEGWGLLDRDWEGWRSESVVREYFGDLVEGTVGNIR